MSWALLHPSSSMRSWIEVWNLWKALEFMNSEAVLLMLLKFMNKNSNDTGAGTFWWEISSIKLR